MFLAGPAGGYVRTVLLYAECLEPAGTLYLVPGTSVRLIPGPRHHL